MSVVSLKDVHKFYPLGKERIEAVRGVSFDIEKGEFAAVSGPSGSGKSTILNMIGLIDLPSSGSIVIGDTDVYDGVDLADAETVNTRWSSAGPDKKDLWRWKHCHPNCAECFEKGNNTDNKCTMCRPGYYFYCNQTEENGEVISTLLRCI